ncbi:MAG: ATP-binding protein [Methanobrevibacter sp.]|jgi:Holliday junction resolvase-like predicted endonuclease|nr:ATP-binding protein [Candidatus Methanovirga procula]
MKDLPIDIGTFSTVIENNYIYVDKTEDIYKIAKPGKKYFLSRPRRFGKSLLLSTIKELYRGNKLLFKDLYIYDKWDWDKKHPIVHLDFGERTYSDENKLSDSLNNFIEITAEDSDIQLKDNDLVVDRFSELIKKLSKKTNQKVVILIDEYDKAIMDNINDLKLANSIRSELNSFYSVLKSLDEFIEFMFITGVTKFSKTSIFSGLNNITDITLDYPCICGYTQKEIEFYFMDKISAFAEKNNVSDEDLLDLIKQWYNGYSWNGENFVYNPYSVLLLLKKNKFNNYWFTTGTPSFLINLLKSNVNNMDVLLNHNPQIMGEFPNFDFENLDFTTILLQTGYLTIKEEESIIGKLPKYTLSIPNKEVHDSLFTHILSYYTTQSVGAIPPLADQMLTQIIKNDEESLQRSFNILLSNIPYSLYYNVKEDIREANYHMMFLSWLQLLGLDIQGGVLTSKGRMDAILKKDDLIVVIEIKYSQNKSLSRMLNEALSQIRKKEYYKSYINDKPILLAVAIKDRDVACKIEIIE